MVSAWVYENHACFGQIKVDDKSNEITAIPELLKQLQLEEATVTIDAMGCRSCQREQGRRQHEVVDERPSERSMPIP